MLAPRWSWESPRAGGTFPPEYLRPACTYSAEEASCLAGRGPHTGRVGPSPPALGGTGPRCYRSLFSPRGVVLKASSCPHLVSPQVREEGQTLPEPGEGLRPRVP